jgi:hypothetical protein
MASCATREVPPEERYPANTPRSEILQMFGEPSKHVDLSARVEDKRLENVAEGVRRQTGTMPASCDIYHVLRGLFGMGMYEDYVFYTTDDLVLQTRRRFLD